MFSIRVWIFWLLLTCLVGCTAPQASVVPTAVQAVPSPQPAIERPVAPTEATDLQSDATTAIRTGVADTMERYAVLYRAQQIEGLDDVTDSVPVKRLLSNWIAQGPSSAERQSKHYRVLEVKPRPAGIIEAEIQNEEGNYFTMLFRQRGEQQWVITELTEAELGEHQTISTTHFRVESYAAYYYTERIAQLAEEAYKRITSFFPTLSTKPIILKLRPSFGVGSPMSEGTIGFYNNAAREPELVVVVPGAVNFPVYSGPLDWEGVIQDTIGHELVHLIHDHSPGPMPSRRGMPAWLQEGIAEYVGVPIPTNRVRNLLREEEWLPLVSDDRRALIYLDELSGNDRVTAYLQAQLFIAYIGRKSTDDIWTFASIYVDTPGIGSEKLNQALTTTFGINITTFTTEWKQWVQEEVASLP